MYGNVSLNVPKYVPECTEMNSLSGGNKVKLYPTSDEGTETDLYIYF